MKEINAVDFEKEVIQGGRVVLDFYSTECPPCEALAPKFEGLSILYGNEIKFLKIFRQQNRELSDKLGVKSSPTLLFFDGGKEVAERLVGGYIPDFYGAYLDQRMHTARMAVKS